MIIDGQKVSEGTLQEILDSTGTKDLEDAFFELYRSRKGGGVDEEHQRNLQ